MKLAWFKAAREFAIIFVILFLIFRFIIGVSWVDGDSMYPTLHSGQAVVYNRLADDYGRGDIISVKMPGGQYYIKRIAAVAGDTVDLIDGTLYVNGTAEILSRPVNTDPQSALVEYPLTLEEGQIFVLGDNRTVSVDSRTFGAIALSQTRGRVFFYFDKN